MRGNAALVVTLAGLVWSQNANLAPRPEGELAGAHPGNGPFAGEPVRMEDGRIDIAEPTRITEPGSYVLTRNVHTSENRVFEIEASDVLLDLNGFTVETASATGIYIAVDVENVTVRNGTIRADLRAVWLSGTFTVLEDLQLVADTALQTVGGTWLRIERCRIYGREAEIEVRYAQGVTIAHNTFGGYSGNACILAHDTSLRATIRNNKFYNCGDAITRIDHPRATIAANEIQGDDFLSGYRGVPAPRLRGTLSCHPGLRSRSWIATATPRMGTTTCPI